VWTLVPSLAILAASRPARRDGRVAGALVCWIAVVTASNVALGAAGYSKLLRYVVLITPATVALAGLAAAESARLIVEAPQGTARRVRRPSARGGARGGHRARDRAWRADDSGVPGSSARLRPRFGEPR